MHERVPEATEELEALWNNYANAAAVPRHIYAEIVEHERQIAELREQLPAAFQDVADAWNAYVNTRTPNPERRRKEAADMAYDQRSYQRQVDFVAGKTR